MEDKIKILIAFDIKDDRPYKAVRLYTANGQSIGFGEIKVNTIEEKKDLFHSEVGYITYAAYIEPDKLFKKSGEPIKELKTIDPDIKATDDPEEDEWVADQMKHLKDAKAKTDLYTEENLRQQYREYKRKRESKPIKETEPTEKNETVTELISTRGEQVMKDIEKEESNVEVESEEVDKIIYTPTKEFAPLAAYRGSDGNRTASARKHSAFCRLENPC